MRERGCRERLLVKLSIPHSCSSERLTLFKHSKASRRMSEFAGDEFDHWDFLNYEDESYSWNRGDYSIILKQDEDGSWIVFVDADDVQVEDYDSKREAFRYIREQIQIINREISG